MPEPCAFYSTRNEPFSFEEVQDWAGNAELAVEGERGSWRTITIRWADCTMTLHGEQRSDLATQLEGMRGYIWKCTGNMTAALYALLQRTYLIRAVYGTISEPCIAESAETFLKRAAAAGCGLIFRENAFFNPNLELLVEPGRVVESHHPSYWKDALDRRNETVALLRSRGHTVPETLPPVPGELEVRLRSHEEIISRAKALHAVASRAVPKGIGRRAAWALIRSEEDSLTPDEAKFLKEYFPSKEDRIRFSWRYESLVTLFWAMGIWPEGPSLLDPVQVNDVDAIMQGVREPGSPKVKVRPATEILDQLDLVYRYHWLTTHARVAGGASPPEVDPGIIYERHHALSWLTCHQDSEWDDVSTDT